MGCEYIPLSPETNEERKERIRKEQEKTATVIAERKEDWVLRKALSSDELSQEILIHRTEILFARTQRLADFFVFADSIKIQDQRGRKWTFSWQVDKDGGVSRIHTQRNNHEDIELLTISKDYFGECMVDHRLIWGGFNVRRNSEQALTPAEQKFEELIHPVEERLGLIGKEIPVPIQEILFIGL